MADGILGGLVVRIGFRADEDKLWTPSAEMHSSDALLLSQWGPANIKSGTRWRFANGLSGPKVLKRKSAR